MERTPEPEVMDAPEQARAYADADFEAVNQGLVDRFLETFPAPPRLLDLGTGPADIPIRFCRALPSLRIEAVDAAGNMLRLGREAVDAAGLAARVGLLQAYLPKLPLADASYPAVFSNSLLHHMARPEDLWSEVRRLAAPGAAVFVCDLFRPESAAAAARIVADADCSDDPVLERDFYNSLLAAYTPSEVRAQLAAAGLGGLRVDVISERHLLVWGRAAG